MKQFIKNNLDAYKHMFDYSGKATYKQFWDYWWGWYIFNGVPLFIDISLFGFLDTNYIPYTFLIALVITMFTWISLLCRRMNDLDKPKWYAFIPIYGLFLVAFAKTTEDKETEQAEQEEIEKNMTPAKRIFYIILFILCVIGCIALS